MIFIPKFGQVCRFLFFISRMPAKIYTQSWVENPFLVCHTNTHTNTHCSFTIAISTFQLHLSLCFESLWLLKHVQTTNILRYQALNKIFRCSSYTMNVYFRIIKLMAWTHGSERKKYPRFIESIIIIIILAGWKLERMSSNQIELIGRQKTKNQYGHH